MKARRYFIPPCTIRYNSSLQCMPCPSPGKPLMHYMLSAMHASLYRSVRSCRAYCSSSLSLDFQLCMHVHTQGDVMPRLSFMHGQA